MFHWQFLIIYIFSASLKFRACFITSQQGEFIGKITASYFHKILWRFFVFYQKMFVFIYFISFFWWSIAFPQQNINQSETGIGDKILSVQLYVTGIITNLTSNYKYWWGVMGYKFLKVRHLCISHEYAKLEPWFIKLAGGFLIFKTSLVV